MRRALAPADYVGGTADLRRRDSGQRRSPGQALHRRQRDDAGGLPAVPVLSLTRSGTDAPFRCDRPVSERQCNIVIVLRVCCRPTLAVLAEWLPLRQSGVMARRNIGGFPVSSSLEPFWCAMSPGCIGTVRFVSAKTPMATFGVSKQRGSGSRFYGIVLAKALSVVLHCNVPPFDSRSLRRIA